MGRLLRESRGEALSHMLVDEGGEALAGFGERLHRFNLLLSGDGVVVAVAVPVLKLDVDVTVSEGEGDDAGGSAQVSVGLHVGWMGIGWERSGRGVWGAPHLDFEMWPSRNDL